MSQIRIRVESFINGKLQGVFQYAEGQDNAVKDLHRFINGFLESENETKMKLEIKKLHERTPEEIAALKDKTKGNEEN